MNLLGFAMSVFIAAMMTLMLHMMIGAPMGSAPISEEFVYDDNAFSVMAGNWTEGMYSVEYRNVYDDYTIPVTYELINMLANDYPCANEQFAALTIDNVPIEVDIGYASPVAMRVDVVGDVPPGSYVLHSHPLQKCGDFNRIDVLTFPSSRDLISETSEGFDNIIIVTKTSNSTARVCRVTGFAERPEVVEKYDDEVNGLFGYIGDGTDIYEMFEETGIQHRFFTITAQENTIFVTGD